MHNSIYIGLIGAGEAAPDTLRMAFEVGALIAKTDAILVCGGLGGVMEEACRGAKTQGGTTIGILPGEKRTEGNSYLDFAIATGVGYARNLAITATADILIAVGGEYGTLSEIGFARKLRKKVIGLSTWSLQNTAGAEHIIRANSPEEAVELAMKFIARP